MGLVSRSVLKRKPKHYRKFGERTYYLDQVYDNKGQATEWANQVRQRGRLVRVVPLGGHHYGLYFNRLPS